MSRKDFASWHQLKNYLQEAELRMPFFYEQEIWWINMGLNLGSEEDGKGTGFLRPVIILRRFNRQLFYGVPISTTTKTGPFYYSFSEGIAQPITALLSQVRAYDSRRLDQ